LVNKVFVLSRIYFKILSIFFILFGVGKNKGESAEQGVINFLNKGVSVVNQSNSVSYPGEVCEI
jgi:hypothetical protein